MFSFLLAAISSNALVLGATSESVLIPIDAGVRGTQIAATFASTAFPHATGSLWPEFILQTTLLPGLSRTYGSYVYMVNGRIPFVQSIAETTNNTLLVVTYKPLPSQNTQTIVVPTEHIVDLIYVPYLYTEPLNANSFTMTMVPKQIPFYNVDPVERGADIVSAVTQLQDLAVNTAQSQVWIQTNFSGPFNPPMNSLGVPGLIQNVLTASVLAAGLIQVTYLPLNQQVDQTILLTPEQVQLILYIPYYNTPQVPR